MANGKKRHNKNDKTGKKAAFKDGQKIYELQLRMTKYEQMKLLLEHRVIEPAKLAGILEMNPEQKERFFKNKMTAPELVSLYNDEKGAKIKKVIFKARHRLFYVDEQKKDGSFTMISILSKRRRFKADEILTAVSVSFEDAAAAYKRIVKTKKTQVKKSKVVHYVISEDQGFSEYDGTDLAEFCFDLPEGIPASVKTIEFKGHKYDLAKYRQCEAGFNAIDRDWDKTETAYQFVELIKTEAKI